MAERGPRFRFHEFQTLELFSEKKLDSQKMAISPYLKNRNKATIFWWNYISNFLEIIPQNFRGLFFYFQSWTYIQCN